MMQKFIIFIFMIAVASNATAGDLEALKGMGFSDEQVATLMQGQRLDNLVSSEAKIALMPSTKMTDQMRLALKDKKPSTVVEALYYLPKYNGASQKALYNSLLKLSSLSGLEYYSRSEKRTKTLIYSVQVIAGPGSSELLPDPTVTTVPAEQRYYIRQDDETFGLADYEALFLADAQSGELGINLTNISVLKKSGIKMASPQEMQTLIIMIPMAEGTLLYSVISNKKSPPSFVREKMNQSLLNRSDAFKNWFTSRYNK